MMWVCIVALGIVVVGGGVLIFEYGVKQFIRSQLYRVGDVFYLYQKGVNPFRDPDYTLVVKIIDIKRDWVRYQHTYLYENGKKTSGVNETSKTSFSIYTGNFKKAKKGDKRFE